MEMKKKEYTAPELAVVEMGHQVQPLCGSCEYGCEDDPPSPLGLAPTSNDHLA